LRNTGSQAVVAIGSSALSFVQAEEPPCPLVYTMVLNPSRLVRQPNLTGVSLDVNPSVLLNTYQKLFPQHRTLGAAYNPTYSRALVEELREQAKLRGLYFNAVACKTREEVLRAQRELSGVVDGFVMVPDALTASAEAFESLSTLVVPLSKPLIGLKSSEVEKGAAFAFLIDYAAVGRQTAFLVERVLKGEPVPPERPRDPVLCINRVVLEHMGIAEIPPLPVPVKKVFPR
jgi:putative ABC transport system substrate-binding protein